MPGTILFVENNPSFQDTYAELLELEGYLVLKATSLSQAAQLLTEHNVHLALVDLRLNDDNDPDDESGLDFVRDPLYDALPKIVLTAYPSFSTTRQAMRQNEKGIQPAVDYLDKRDAAKTLLPALAHAFDTGVRIDWNLAIRWRQRGGSFIQLAALIADDETPTRVTLLAEAMEDLFRKLFFARDQITIGEVLFQSEGYVMLEVLAHAESGIGDAYALVACGQKEALIRQIEQHREYAPDDSIVGATLLKGQGETLYLAAAVYELSGAEFGEVITFQDFYAAHTAHEVDALLANFYQSTVQRWHKQGRETIEGTKLTDAYQAWLGLTVEQLQEEKLNWQVDTIAKQAMTRALARIEREQRLHFYFADDAPEAYPNPARGAADLDVKASTLAGVVHGYLNSHTVLAASNGQAWLIDASHADKAPLLVDYVRMEADLLLRLAVGIDISEWHELQRRLTDVIKLDQKIDTAKLSPAAQDALSAVHVIRRSAAEDVGTGVEPYFLGLYYCYLAEVTQFDPTQRYPASDLMPFVRSLLAATMIRQKLAAPQAKTELPPQALNSLWLDPVNPIVWMEGRQVDLTPQEYKIFGYLYERRGKLCTRQQIVTEALGEPDADPNTENQRLNSAMKRLREKLNDDPDHPRYLQSLRGQGYRLNL